MFLNYKIVITICFIIAITSASSNLNLAKINENYENGIELDRQDPNANILIDSLNLISQNYRTSVQGIDQNSKAYIDKSFSFYQSVTDFLLQNKVEISSLSATYVTMFASLYTDISNSLTLMSSIKSHVESMEKQILDNQLNYQIPILEANRQKQYENQQRVEAELAVLKAAALNKAQCKNDPLTSILLQVSSRVRANEKAKTKLNPSSDTRINNIKNIIESCNAGFFATFPPTVCYVKPNGIATSEIPYRCPSGFERKMLICYQACPNGYYHECGRCYPSCSAFYGAGYSDSLLFCTSPTQSIMKTVIDPVKYYNDSDQVKCDVSELGGYEKPDKQVKIGALCYPNCQAIYMVQCGIDKCAINKAACDNANINQMIDIAIAVYDLVGFILSGGFSAIATLPTKSVAKSSLKRASKKLVSKFEYLVKKGIATVEKAIIEDTLDKVGDYFKDVAESLLEPQNPVSNVVKKFLKQTNDSAKSLALANFSNAKRSEVNFGYQFNTLCDITTQFNIEAVIERRESEDLINTDDIIDVVDVIGITTAINTCDKAANGDPNPDNVTNCVKSVFQTAAMFDPSGLVSLAAAFIYPVCDVPRILYTDPRSEEEKIKAKVRVGIYTSLYKTEYAKLRLENQNLINENQAILDPLKIAYDAAVVNMTTNQALLDRREFVHIGKRTINKYYNEWLAATKLLDAAKERFDYANKKMKILVTDLQKRAHNIAIMNEIKTNPDLAPGLVFKDDTVIPSEENYTDMLGVAVTGVPPSFSKRTDLFARGSDGGLMNMSKNGSEWSVWTKVEISPLVLTSGPSATTDNNASISVYFRGEDLALYRKVFLNGSGWQTAENLGGTLYSSPSACSDGVKITVLAVGPNYTLMRKYFNGTAWQEWQDISKEKRIAAKPTCVYNVGLQIFALGEADGYLWELKQDNENAGLDGIFLDWKLYPELKTNPVSVNFKPKVCVHLLASGDNLSILKYVDLFAVDTGKKIIYRYSDNVTNNFSSWSNSAFESASNVVSVSPFAQSTEIDLFHRREDGTFYLISFKNASWEATFTELRVLPDHL